MALAVGVRLGPYEIHSLLGVGGMGEVYKAQDTRLDRTVAIKILPEHVADDPDRRQRFEQEARAVSALNHPHICVLHDIGSAPSTASIAGHVDYLVMEYVEGQTLAERLAKGPVPLSQALEYAVQIADALACAHDTHIVHRDLKPGNIMLTKSGVKLLDFGLAKLRAAATTSGTAGASELLTRNPTTTPGSVLGTVQYMPPEQLEGRDVDARADLWAFGCVLYEMTTGRHAFEGRSHASLIAAILEHEPIAMATVHPMSPPSLEHVVRRCLAKEPDQRWQSARDVLYELRWIADSTAGADVRAAGRAQRGRTVWPWLAAAVLATAGGALVGYVEWSHGPAPREAAQLAIELPAYQEIIIGGQAVPTFSPDGRSLVFGGCQNGRELLFRRTLRDSEARAIPGTDDGDAPFFSPDGRWIGFRQGKQLVKVPVEGGRPFPIARSNQGAVWLTDGTIVYNPAYTDGLFRVSSDSGTPERLTTPDRTAGELGHWWPDVLPGGRFVIFTALRSPVDRSRVGVLDLQTRKVVRWIVDGGFFARYAPPGHVLYAKGRRLFALPFDPVNARATGAGVVVRDDVFTDPGAGSAAYAVSIRGALAYVTEALGNPPRELVWLDREGHSAPATSERHAYESVSLSRDGRRAAVTRSEENFDLWILSEHGVLSRLTSADVTEFDPRWSINGRELFYVVSTPNHVNYELYRMDVGKPDSGRLIWDQPAGADAFGIAISPDGRAVAFERDDPQTRRIYIRSLEDSAPAYPLRAATRAEQLYASFSPNGRWIAYQSNETERPEIYVDPLAGGGDHTQISSGGGTEPIWAQNGEIFYRAGDGIYVCRVRLAPRFEADTPRLLFRAAVMMRTSTSAITRMFDVTPDGKRILAVTIPEESRPRQIDLLLDWAATLTHQNR